MSLPIVQKRKAKPVMSVVLSMTILNRIAEKGGVSTLGDIADQLGVSRSQIWRHITTLTENGWLSRRNAGYKLGPRLSSLLTASVSNLNLDNAIAPELTRLARQLSLPVVFCVPAGVDAVVVRCNDGTESLSKLLEPGFRMPATVWPASWVTLAYSSDSTRETTTARRFDKEVVSAGIMSTSDVRNRCSLVRNQRQCVGPGPESLGVWSIAAPVFDAKNELVAVLSVVAPREEFGSYRQRSSAKLLQMAAANVSEKLGAPDYPLQANWQL